MAFKITNCKSIRYLKSVIVGMMLLVSHIPVLSALDESPSNTFNSSISIDSSIVNQSFAIQQDIEALNNRIINFTDNMLEMLILNSELDGKCNNESDFHFEPFGGFIPPDVQAKVDKLHKKVQGMKEIVEELRNSTANNESIRERLDVLENSVNNLIRLIDDTVAELWCRIDDLRKLVDAFERTLNSFGEELNEIKDEANHLLDPEVQSRLRKEIIREIRNREYDSALKKLTQLDGDFTDNINYLIHEVYNNREDNFDVILRLGDRSRNATISLAIYQGLAFEMELAKSKNYFMLLMLIDSLTRNVINNSSSSSAELEEGKYLKSELRNKAKDLIIPELKDLLVNGSYERTELIFEKIYDHEYSLFHDVFKPVLHSLSGEYFWPLLDFLTGYKNEVQRVFAVSDTYFELKTRTFEKHSSDILVKVAFALKDVYPKCKLWCIEAAVAKAMKDDLTPSVRNLVFAKQVCFYNVRNGEYMYAANDNFKYDDERRSVFSWVPGERVTQGFWTVEPQGREYYIKNTAHNEYLYAANVYFSVWKERRHVFTWVKGNVDSGQFNWQLQPDGNKISIRSSYYREYLIADDEKIFDEDRRYVLTWTEGRMTVDSEWLVEDCS